MAKPTRGRERLDYYTLYHLVFNECKSTVEVSYTS